MNYYQRFFLCVSIPFLLLLSFFPCSFSQTVHAASSLTESADFELRGVWVSYFEFFQLGLSNKSKSVFTQNANRMFQTAKAHGFNAVFLHVRSHDDAIYPSTVTGWSKYISYQGRGLSYDPLKILVRLAHKNDMEFHAWMNPYRITETSTLNPASSSTINRIVSQVKEIISNYDVDGIHFDDYFYPSNELRYRSVPIETRKRYVNKMIRKVYKTIKKKSKSIRFGVSPAGDLSYCNSIGADVWTWLSAKGYVDYIAPQIYWSDHYILHGQSIPLYSNRIREWTSLNKLHLPMYIGLAGYKAGETLSEDPGWRESSWNLYAQLGLAKKAGAAGYLFFKYSDLLRGNAKNEVINMMYQISTMTLSKTRMTLSVGKKQKLFVTALSPAALQTKIIWKSKQPEIASVSKKGVVTANSAGKTKIYAYCRNLRRTCVVKVRKSIST